VRRTREIGAHAGAAANQGRQAPAREEHAQHHHERDRDGRDAERHQLGGRLGRAEPRARGHARQHTERLEPPEPRGSDRRRRVYSIHESSSTPAAKTPSGIQKWRSPSRAAAREREGRNARKLPRLCSAAMDARCLAHLSSPASSTMARVGDAAVVP